MCKCGLVIIKNSKFDLWIDCVRLNSFPATIRNGRRLGQIFQIADPGIAVLPPLFGRPLINIHRPWVYPIIILGTLKLKSGFYLEDRIPSAIWRHSVQR